MMLHCDPNPCFQLISEACALCLREYFPYFFIKVWSIVIGIISGMIKKDGWMNQAYSRLSTTHGHITDCKLVCLYWTRLVLVRPAVSRYSASPLKHHPTCK